MVGDLDGLMGEPLRRLDLSLLFEAVVPARGREETPDLRALIRSVA